MTTHACGGTILVGGNGEQKHSYCDKCRAFAYGDADVPAGVDRAANQAAWDNQDEESPSYRYVIEARIGEGLWAREGGANDTTDYATREEAEEAMGDLEPTNDDGDAIEYRVVEA